MKVKTLKTLNMREKKQTLLEVGVYNVVGLHIYH
jgi:hypothetical protein